jgi:hypothetical protein
MMFIRSIYLSFTIWVLTVLLDALLYGTWLSLFSKEFSQWWEAFIAVVFFTLLFSIPGMFIFWMVLLVNWKQELLFRSLLKTIIIVSAVSSMLLYLLPLGVLRAQLIFLSRCIVIAAIVSTMIHHRKILSIIKN